MRILLIGDYSGVHCDMATELRRRNVDVCVASDGDGYRNFPRDIQLGAIFTGNRLIFHVLNVMRDLIFLAKIFFIKFDIIQILNVSCINSKIRRFTWAVLLSKRAKFILLICGDDPIVVQYYKTDNLTTDYDYDIYTAKRQTGDFRNVEVYLTSRTKELHSKIMKKASSIIALSTEVMRPYVFYGYNVDYIPISVDVSRIKYASNVIDGKIKILHSINRGREIFKGTPLIIDALNYIGTKYRDSVEILYSENVPFEEYTKLVSRVNIVLDQIFGYSPGMNALYLMLAGRIVMSGCEQEYLEQLGIVEAPICNIRPSVDHIVRQVEHLLSSHNEFGKLGKESQEYVNNYHNISKNILQFLTIWNSKLDFSKG